MKYQIELEDTDCFFVYGLLHGQLEKVKKIDDKASIVLERVLAELLKSMKGHENDPLR